MFAQPVATVIVGVIFVAQGHAVHYLVEITFEESHQSISLTMIKDK